MCLGLAMMVSVISAAAPSEAANYAGIVVDANTGNVLYSQDADTLHYPASLTKMMTLYLTFEALEAGRIALDTPVPYSAKASGQAPTKLGIRPGGTVTVEQAILSMVTLSANDSAMALGEFVGGSEENFARMMNNKARALGMTRTTYRNPNGLPNTAQMTTARDQARLGIALREHFPQYYSFFSTREFRFGKRVIGNHNHLVGTVRGVDGIKTGFTNAAGYNLVTSLKVDGRSVVGVVLGGASWAARDNQMRKLMEAYVPKASVRSGADKYIAEAAPPRAVAPTPPAPIAEVAQNTPVAVEPDAAAAAARMGGNVALPTSGPTPSARYDGDPESAAAAFAAVTPHSSNPLVSGKAHKQGVPANQIASIAPSYAESSAEPEAVDPLTTSSTPGESAAPVGWVVQVGVSPSKDMANEMLDTARSKGGKALASAKAYAVAMGTGDATIYRARFGGFEDQREATSACSTLKRAGVKCWASRQ